MKLIRPFVAIAVAALALTSCLDRLTPEDFEKNRPKPDDFFSFFTTDTVALHLDYGKTGSRALIRVYGEDPLLAQDGHSLIRTDVEPLYQRFTDSKGQILTNIQLPSYIKDGVWICSNFMTIPEYEYCEIENGTIFNWNPVAAEATKAGRTKAVASNLVQYQLNGNFYTLAKWQNKYGKPDDVNQMITDGDLSSSDLSAIRTAVWNGKSSKPSNLDNSKYADKGTEWINTNIREHYHDASGKVQTVTSAEIFFTFVQESGWNQNVVGYYFYPSGQAPASPDDLKKYIIIPNSSISGNPPYGADGFIKDQKKANAPFKENQKVQLLYEDSDGNLTPDFPPNTTIGYFIIANGWNIDGKTKFPKDAVKSTANTKAINADVSVTVDKTINVSLEKTYSSVSWSSSKSSIASVSGDNSGATIKGISEGKATITAKVTTWYLIIPVVETVGTWEVTVTGDGMASYDGAIDFTKPVYYSNSEWNSKNRCMTRSTGNYLIYGFEDGDDKTYEDVLFTISASPALAVIDPANPDIIDPEEIIDEKLKIGERYFATYCFEDLWPNRGDYDMNDVVIEHRAAMFFDNDNDLLEVRDTFTVCNEILSSGEGVKDAFAIRIPTDERGLISLPAGVVDETETESIILFENAQANLTKSFVITRSFDKGTVQKDAITYGIALDPYIIPVMPGDKVSYTESNRREVHFPKKPGTINVDPRYYQNTVEAYYVDRDNKHPFAISIPLPVAKTREEIAKAKKDGSMFIIPSEMYPIDGQYAKSGHSFTEWVSSLGTNSTDWYRNYKTSGPDQVERVEMNTYK